MITIKRVYDPPAPEDGMRILVDRLWPRGISKDRASLDEWMREIAPGSELRAWFGHRQERFAEFAESYVRELSEDPVRLKLADRLLEYAVQAEVTLVYAAKDPVRNHAAVLRNWLQARGRVRMSGNQREQDRIAATNRFKVSASRRN